MKQSILLRLIACVFIVIGSVALLAQNAPGVDDRGVVNDPLTNPRANACYTGGSLDNTCVTQYQWECGWYFIRYENGLLPRELFPSSCAYLLPYLPTSTPGLPQNSDSSDTATQPAPNATQILPSPSPTFDDGCVWSMPTQDQPALAQEAVGRVSAAGFNNVSATASTTGESCYKPATGEQFYTPLSSAFTISVDADETADFDALAGTIYNAIRAMTIPGLSTRVNINFVTPGGTFRRNGEL